MKITGTIQRGAGKGAFFTQLDWVVQQCMNFLDFKPFPGTLNVVVREDDIPSLEAFFSEKDFEFVPESGEFCSAHVKRVLVNGVSAAVVFPSEDVRIHGKAVIEIISEFNLKETLRLKDGDEVSITHWNR